MTAPDCDLSEAIENLYRVFARYPLRLTVDGCPDCVSSNDNACSAGIWVPLNEVGLGVNGDKCLQV
jgi:hypothetical protein